MAKTIAAMANTWGGIIIIGVEDEDSRPKLPVQGINYKEHLREQINNIILGNIMPPVFPEIQVCPPENNKTFIVIRVPQSNLTPHAIKNNTKVYIRTDTSNEPEELAKINRVLWLVEKRNKSTQLKQSFYDRAEERFDTLCKREKMSIEHADTIFSICPLYPFEILTDFEKLREEIPQKMKVGNFPRYLYNWSAFNPTQNGAYGFSFNENTKYILYEELNHYGFFYHRDDLCRIKKDNNEQLIHNVLLWTILERLNLFFASMLNFYTELGCWGLLEVKIIFDKLDNVIFRDLPPLKGYRRFEHISKSPIDSQLEFVKTITLQELEAGRMALLVSLLKEISWAIGFSHIKSETIKELIEENNLL